MKYVVLLLKGMAYGVTNLLPGIGGGLILIIMGIYDQFVDIAGNFFLQFRSRWKEFLAFIIPMGLGAVVGMVAFAKLVEALIKAQPAVAMFFFMGLVVGTIPAVWRMRPDMRLTFGRGIAFVCGLLVVVLFKTAENLELGAGWATSASHLPGFLYYVFSNFIAGGASVTPGMDGSYIWMLTGTFQGVMGAIGSVTEARHVLGSGGIQAAMAGIQWATLIATGIGAVAGIVIFSKLIDTAIKRTPAVTNYVVLGLVVASVYGLWPTSKAAGGIVFWPLEQPVNLLTIVGPLLALVVGGGITWFLGRREAETASEE